MHGQNNSQINIYSFSSVIFQFEKKIHKTEKNRNYNIVHNIDTSIPEDVMVREWCKWKYEKKKNPDSQSRV